jgi:hypothetical protein
VDRKASIAFLFWLSTRLQSTSGIRCTFGVQEQNAITRPSKLAKKGAFGGFSGLNCLGMTSEKAKAKRLMLWDEKELC